ncbi:hypothetical protein BpHYR1_014420 [Brachionus plicatilis]|uniref:Uncharacterized protein n=1 Tax=Brachionus plicatilis TaxID=10195 RepID=A0A3M7Q8G5_BRAPC|nr:hypothetical protein BpHYR1_014420 [Brachionus plicatilis]
MLQVLFVGDYERGYHCYYQDEVDYDAGAGEKAEQLNNGKLVMKAAAVVNDVTNMLLAAWCSVPDMALIICSLLNGASRTYDMFNIFR